MFGPKVRKQQNKNAENKKRACINRSFLNCKAFLHRCRKKAFEEKPITSKWVIVTYVRKSYRVGISDPSRPDFPEYGYRFFQIILSIQTQQGSACNIFYTKFKRQNQQNNGKIQHLIKIPSFAPIISFFGSSAAFSKAKFRFKSQNLAPANPSVKPVTTDKSQTTKILPGF